MLKLIELPEAVNLARLLQENFSGRVIKEVVVGKSPHKFAFYSEPEQYGHLLNLVEVFTFAPVASRYKIKGVRK